MKNKGRKLLAPILVTVLMVIYYIMFFGFLIVMLPGLWRWVLGIVPLVLGGVMIWVCAERIREIKGGEEDDLSQY